MNYFDLFNLAHDFVLDKEDLQNRYRILIERFHPDRAAALSSFEQKEAMMATAALNDAYRMLADDLNRAAYLLKEQGIDADSPAHTHFSAEFLMQQMQWREALEENNFSGCLKDEIEREYEKIINQLRENFAAKNFQAALDALLRGRFIAKLLSEIRESGK